MTDDDRRELDELRRAIVQAARTAQLADATPGTVLEQLRDRAGHAIERVEVAGLVGWLLAAEVALDERLEDAQLDSRLERACRRLTAGRNEARAGTTRVHSEMLTLAELLDLDKLPRPEPSVLFPSRLGKLARQLVDDLARPSVDVEDVLAVHPRLAAAGERAVAALQDHLSDEFLRVGSTCIELAAEVDRIVGLEPNPERWERLAAGLAALGGHYEIATPTELLIRAATAAATQQARAGGRQPNPTIVLFEVVNLAATVAGLELDRRENERNVLRPTDLIGPDLGLVSLIGETLACAARLRAAASAET